MAEFGTLTLYALLLLATWSGALALVGARRRSAPMVHAARRSLYGTAVLSSVSILVLAWAFVASDFSITYVERFSDRAMPLFYKLTAVWGGQEGSLLLWTWMLAVLSAWAVHINQERLRELIPWIIVVLTLVIIFFCLLLLVSANPFDTYLMEVPVEGKGLNPLLQNAYMVTHPPALYIGYVGMTIPFAFAVAALISGHTDESWVQAARPWAMAAWYFLSMGLVLGMLWAYEELGWGGYWAWDPVENAGLFPWLTATAYIHSVMVQERRGMLKIWNVVLAVLTFELTIFGTFLTRSGFIESVHAFAQSDIGWYFLVFMGVVATFAAALIIWRRPLLRSRGELESVLSREFIFVINNWVLLSAAFLVMVLTIFPNISQLFGNKITISAPAFNRWMIPIGMTLLVLTGVGPLFGWRKTTPAGLKRQFTWPLAAALAAAVGLYAAGVHKGLPLVTFALCAMVLAQVVQEIVRGIAVRRRSSGVDPLTAFVGLISRNRRRYGGYIVHLGIVLMYLGFAGEAYKLERELLMRRGERATVGDYTLRFDGVEDGMDAQKKTLTATLTVFDSSGKRLGTIHPARWVYFKHEGQPTTEVDIRRSAREDLFVVLGSHDPASGAMIKIIVNPLVNWMWIGFILLTIGTGIALLPVRAQRAIWAASRVAPLLLAVLLSALLIGGPRTALADEKSGPAPPQGTAMHRSSELEQKLFERFACMCPTCPRIPLADCQCGFAGKERTEIRKKIGMGWNEERILKWYLEERGPELGREPFGQVALTTPPDTGWNRVSWLLPYALSLFAVVALVLLGRRWTRSRKVAGPAQPGEATPGAALPEKQQQVYDDLLDRELKKLD